MIEYFVSYSWIDSNGNQGIGNEGITVPSEFDTFKDIKDWEEAILAGDAILRNRGLTKIKIINFIKLRKVDQ